MSARQTGITSGDIAMRTGNGHPPLLPASRRVVIGCASAFMRHPDLFQAAVCMRLADASSRLHSFDVEQRLR